MPLSTLDPKTALIVIDLQKGIVALSLLCIRSRGGREQRPRARGRIPVATVSPVVLVNVAGGAPGRTEQPRGALNFRRRDGPNLCSRS